MEIEDQKVAEPGRSASSLAVSSVHALAFILMVSVGLVFVSVIATLFLFALAFVGAAWGWQWALVILLVPGVVMFIGERVVRERDQG